MENDKNNTWKLMTAAGATIALIGSAGLIYSTTSGTPPQETTQQETTQPTTPTTEPTNESTKPNMDTDNPENITPEQHNNPQEKIITPSQLTKKQEDFLSKSLSTDEKDIEILYKQVEDKLNTNEPLTINGLTITVSNPIITESATTVKIKATNDTSTKLAFSPMLFNMKTKDGHYIKATTDSIYSLPQLNPNSTIEGELTFPSKGEAIFYTDTETGTAVEWGLN